MNYPTIRHKKVNHVKYTVTGLTTDFKVCELSCVLEIPKGDYTDWELDEYPSDNSIDFRDYIPQFAIINDWKFEQFYSSDLIWRMEYNKQRLDCEYLIDRSGKIHKYKGDLYRSITSIHYEISNQCFPNAQNPKDFINKRGWITVGSTFYYHPICYIEPSQAQINRLDKLNLLDILHVLNENNTFKKFIK